MKNQKGFISIYVIVAIAVAVAISGFVVIKYPNLVTFSDISTTPTPTQSPATNDMAGWKTYTNTQYGFEFKYPTNLVVDTDQGHIGWKGSSDYYGKRDLNLLLINPKIEPSIPGYGGDPGSGPSGNFYGGYNFAIFSGSAATQQTQNIDTASDWVAVKTINTADISYKLFISNGDWQGSPVYFIHFPLGNKYTLLISTGGPNYSIELLQQILSTFKFNSPTPTVSPTVSSGITGSITKGPTCPAIQEGDHACGDLPIAFGEFIIKTAGIYPKEVARFTTNDTGQYAVSLPPGNYTIESGVKIGISQQFYDVTVKAHQVTDFDFVLDTGIR